MDNPEELWRMERQFWSEGAAFYEANLTNDAIMLFPPPVGLLQREQTIETIANAPRWVELEIKEPRKTTIHDEVNILTYQAVARRQTDKQNYKAQVTSAYRRVDGQWRLAFHQQFPIQNP